MSGIKPGGSLQISAALEQVIREIEGVLKGLKRGTYTDGPIYAVDVGTVSIFQINGIRTNAANVGQYPPAGQQFSLLQGPVDVFYCISDGGIYVLDSQLGQLLKFNTLGDITAGTPANNGWWGGPPGAGAQQFTQPGSVIVDSALNKYVADSGNNRIQWIDPNNNWTALYGPAGNQNYLSAPCGLAMDSSGNLIVADTNNGRLVGIEDSSGANPTWHVCAGPPNKTDSFQYPSQVAVDPSSGAIYVVDSYESAVETPGGSPKKGQKPTRLIKMDDFTGAGWTVNQQITNNAWGVAGGATGLIYVTQGSDILMFNGIGDQNPAAFAVPGAVELTGISVPIFFAS